LDEYHFANSLCRASWDGALFHNNGTWLCVGCNIPHGPIKRRHVGGTPSADAKHLGWGIDCHENDVCP
jgi:hypothetical protein